VTEISEKPFIEQLLKKDRTAFRQAIHQYQPAMRALAARIVGESIADEVVQEAWIAMMRGLPTFEGRSSLKTWLLSIVANEAKMRLRKERPSVSFDDMGGADSPLRFDGAGKWLTPPVSWELTSPEAILTASELNDCITATVKGLPFLQASTLQLREFEDLNLKEICNILNVTESNVRVLLHRARQCLYQVIEHFQATGECQPACK